MEPNDIARYCVQKLHWFHQFVSVIQENYQDPQEFFYALHFYNIYNHMVLAAMELVHYKPIGSYLNQASIFL